MFRQWKWPGVGLLTLIVLGAAMVVPLSKAKAGKPQPPPAPAVSYSMTLLPLPMTRAVGMNNFGDVVGEQYLFLAEMAAPVDVNTLAGLPAGVTIWDVADINDLDPADQSMSRQIAGTFDFAGQGSHAYRARVGHDEAGTPVCLEFEDLGVLAGFTTSQPLAINNQGDVVGCADTDAPGASRTRAAVLWPAAGGIVDLVGGQSNSTATDINDLGLVAGSMNVNGASHAFRYTPSGGVQDLGGLPKRPVSIGYGINSSGQVTGYARGTDGSYRAFRYTQGTGMVDLGSLRPNYDGSEGKAINSDGHVVGTSWTGQQWKDPVLPFLYTDSTGMMDLSALVVSPPAGCSPSTMRCTAVNDPAAGKNFGQICGTVAVSNQTRAFVLTPDR